MLLGKAWDGDVQGGVEMVRACNYNGLGWHMGW